MRPFQFARAEDNKAAIAAHGAQGRDDAGAINAPSQYLAGGTTLIDLMKLDVMQPSRVVDINALQKTNSGKIEFSEKGLRLGAMARMSQAADHDDVRKNFPVIAQALQLAASAQIRNMASLGGNVLQRTRCTYFRDTSYPNCNKRNPGSGCAAVDGINRAHAVLGTSEDCIAAYPGDFAQALLALDAQVEIDGPRGARTIPFASLHQPPGKTPHVETTLAPGDLIIAFNIPAVPWAKRSLFLKIRDRESYEFALASAAVALELDNGNVKQVRIALGGVATMPWRAKEAEAALQGKAGDDATVKAAADAAFAQAQPRQHNAFKVELGKRTLIRALHQAAALEI
ncbi:MAG: FAD binding domain-containing protein [Pseudolabrys sp.]